MWFTFSVNIGSLSFNLNIKTLKYKLICIGLVRADENKISTPGFIQRLLLCVFT